VLLQRCLFDNDDEVRDRATFFVAMLKGLEEGGVGIGGLSAKALLMEPLPVPLEALEACCKEYLEAPSETPFSIANVTVAPELLQKEKKAAAAAAAKDEIATPTRAAPTEKAIEAEADLLSKLPQFVHIGQRFSSSKRVALSEPGTEYEVQCVKHVYASHLLLQFSINNTLEDQLLENVTVAVDISAAPGLAFECELPCPKAPYGTPGDSFLCLRRVEGLPIGSFSCTLKFVVKDVDPAKGEPEEDETGYDDEYNLEELEIAAADFMKRVPVLDFREAWDTIGNGCEVVETFSLTYNSLKQAMDAVIDYLGMQICENSGNPAESARTHTVLLAGTFLGGVQVFSIVNLRTDSNKNVGMRLTVRSADMGISQFVASSVA